MEIVDRMERRANLDVRSHLGDDAYTLVFRSLIVPTNTQIRGLIWPDWPELHLYAVGLARAASIRRRANAIGARQ